MIEKALECTDKAYTQTDSVNTEFTYSNTEQVDTRVPGSASH